MRTHLGATLAKSSITRRPLLSAPIEMSKKTLGFSIYLVNADDQGQALKSDFAQWHGSPDHIAFDYTCLIVMNLERFCMACSFAAGLLIYLNTLPASFAFDDNFAVIYNGDVTNDGNTLLGMLGNDFW